MKPSKEILELAKVKTNMLLDNNTQIRIGGAEYEKSYWLFRKDNAFYIGWIAEEKLHKFFKNKPVLQFVSNKTNNVLAEVQRLM
jgi:hypothetical protein